MHSFSMLNYSILNNKKPNVLLRCWAFMLYKISIYLVLEIIYQIHFYIFHKMTRYSCMLFQELHPEEEIQL